MKRFNSSNILPEIYLDFKNTVTIPAPASPFHQNSNTKGFSLFDLFSQYFLKINDKRKIYENKYISYEMFTQHFSDVKSCPFKKKTQQDNFHTTKQSKTNNLAEFSHISKVPKEKCDQFSTFHCQRTDNFMLNMKTFTKIESLNTKTLKNQGKNISPDYLKRLERRSKSLDKGEKSKMMKKQTSFQDIFQALEEIKLKRK